MAVTDFSGKGNGQLVAPPRFQTYSYTHVTKKRPVSYVINKWVTEFTEIDCESIEMKLLDEAQPAIAYYTARLLQDEVKDPGVKNNNKKGARL